MEVVRFTGPFLYSCRSGHFPVYEISEILQKVDICSFFRQKEFGNS